MAFTLLVPVPTRVFDRTYYCVDESLDLRGSLIASVNNPAHSAASRKDQRHVFGRAGGHVVVGSGGGHVVVSEDSVDGPANGGDQRKRRCWWCGAGEAAVNQGSVSGVTGVAWALRAELRIHFTLVGKTGARPRNLQLPSPHPPSSVTRDLRCV